MSLGEMLILSVSILAGLVIVVGLPVVLGLRYAQREREMEHTERMRALETGTSLPQDEPWWTPTKLCAGMGVGVPITVFVLAFAAAGANRSDHDEAIWTAAGAIGALGVICGSRLATRLPITKDRSNQGVDLDSLIKRDHEPDAYDVVSRRG